ncbi:MAG: PQQ-binding-like beta-propeller repeat protein [Gammaproteobacteria bacterium]|nr:PQQ-binding-like beta-propeller repeat protein [Gammaproteobacteria bacterium]
MRNCCFSRGLIFALGGLLISPGVCEQPASDWPVYGYDRSNQRFSPLDQVNTANVGGLQLAWRFATGKTGSFQATPIVTRGVMYVTTPFNHVLALDAATGRQRWRYEHPLPETKTCCGPANRGAAVAYGKVYTVTLDAKLVALDQRTGAPLWSRPLTDSTTDVREAKTALVDERIFEQALVSGATGYSANMAPQVWADTVFAGITGAGYGLHLDVESSSGSALSVVGLSGGGHGARGFLVAFDAHSGAEKWRWYTVPGPSWTGEWRSHTADGVPLNRNLPGEKARAAEYPDTWRIGGGSIWTTPAIDRELGLIYVGTGNPAPQMDDSTRPGDNLHTVSLVAIDAATGKTVWAYQQVPHDRWGYDVASPPVLFESHHAGARVPAVVQASKTGWVFVHDRRNGRLLFKSEPFVPQRNLFTPPSADGVTISPGIFGGASWSPMALDPRRRSVYVAGIHHPVQYFSKSLAVRPDRPWHSFTYTRPLDERSGTITALNIDTGRIRWQRQTELPMVGGLLATAGGVVFTGEGNGRFLALDSSTGETLWSYQGEYGVNAPPITYAVDGRQYVSVAAGGNKLFRFKTGDDILTFVLP